MDCHLFNRTARDTAWHEPVMSFAQRICGSVGLGATLCLIAIAAGMEAGAQSVPLEVTSDTPAYCLRLLDEVTDLVRTSPVPPPPEVNRLSADGQRLCDEGQTRGGIMRLRRAWVLMSHSEGQLQPGAHP
jgi:hypothetical protein